MSRLDGRNLVGTHEASYDVVVVGSGPAGAAAAATIAAAGARVAVVEEGPWLDGKDFARDSFGSMADSYRDMGASLLLGSAMLPFLQGRAVGGSSVVNGAICWRLPRDVHDEWLAADPALSDALAWEEIEQVTDQVEVLHEVAPTPPDVARTKNLLMARGAEALGLAHRPIRRSVRGCRGLGRCMQGCPESRKLSVDRTSLASAERDGVDVLSSVRVEALPLDGNVARGVEAVAEGGGRVRLRASRAVVLAASAVQTPALLLRNRIRQGPVGRFFSCHPGVSLSGRFPEPVRMWDGATQGHEVTGLRHEGLKFEVLGFGSAVLASRLLGTGRELAAAIPDLAHWANWGVAVRSRAFGRVHVVGRRTLVRFQSCADDVVRFRRGLRVMGEMMFAAGAEQVTPDVRGFDERVTDPRRLAALESDGPAAPSAYQAAVTHMFGTCRMGSDPATSVVRPDFRHHGVDRLYVADSSVFPSNLGVNPQIAIMALASLCGRRIAA